MGNCSGICANTIQKYKGDIIMERLYSHPDYKQDEYKINNNIGKLSII